MSFDAIKLQLMHRTSFIKAILDHAFNFNLRVKLDSDGIAIPNRNVLNHVIIAFAADWAVLLAVAQWDTKTWNSVVTINYFWISILFTYDITLDSRVVGKRQSIVRGWQTVLMVIGKCWRWLFTSVGDEKLCWRNVKTSLKVPEFSSHPQATKQTEAKIIEMLIKTKFYTLIFMQ